MVCQIRQVPLYVYFTLWELICVQIWFNITVLYEWECLYVVLVDRIRSLGDCDCVPGWWQSLVVNVINQWLITNIIDKWIKSNLKWDIICPQYLLNCLREVVILDPIRIITWFIAQLTLNFCASKKQATVPITTNIVSSNYVHGEVYSIQHYVIKFVSDLWQVSSFLRVLRFPPPIKLTATI